jgi:hypothetical protein
VPGRPTAANRTANIKNTQLKDRPCPALKASWQDQLHERRSGNQHRANSHKNQDWRQRPKILICVLTRVEDHLVCHDYASADRITSLARAFVVHDSQSLAHADVLVSTSVPTYRSSVPLNTRRTSWCDRWRACLQRSGTQRRQCGNNRSDKH